jgi:ribosomal protein S18 acetylase RimI-like enzyme
MRLRFQAATLDDVDDLVVLHLAVSQQLTSDFGKGPWSGAVSDRGVRFSMTRARIYVARAGKKLVATFALSTRKPWAIDKKYFTPSRLPLYLTSMAVSSARQRKGLGRQCVEEALRIANAWPADAIRLDAWDADAGAGDFYRKCGFREVGRAMYRNAPLIYFELLRL